MSEDLEKRITEYLTLGGLFNPELMDHKAVSELLRDCRDALSASREKLAAVELRENFQAVKKIEAEIGYERALAKLAAVEGERDHWKANHDEMVRRNSVLRDRPDLPVDRLPALARLEARATAAEAREARLKRESEALEDAVILVVSHKWKSPRARAIVDMEALAKMAEVAVERRAALTKEPGE